MRAALLFLAFLLSPLPALAQALQFDGSGPHRTVATGAAPATVVVPGPGLAWLQHKPMTLFDLGMMELTNTANRLAEAIESVRGAVAEYQEERGLIAISFYAGIPYVKDSCLVMARQVRDGMFMQRSDPQRLAHEVSSYFISYGPVDPGRPAGLGAELVSLIRFTIYMQGGTCQIPLIGDNVEAWTEDSPAGPVLPPSSAPPPASAP